MRKQKEHSRTFFGRFKSIQNTMLVSFSVLMVIAVVIFLVIAMNSTKKTIYENSIDYSTQIIKQVNSDIDNYIDYMENTSSLMAKSTDVAKYFFDEHQTEEEFEEEKKRILTQFATIKESRNDISNVAAVAENGKYLVNDEDGSLTDYIDVQSLDWYQEAMQSKSGIAVSSSHVQNAIPTSYKWVITLSRALVNNQSGKREGVFFMDLNYSAISDLCNKNNIGEKGYIFILDEDGNIIYHPKQQLMYGGLMVENIQEIMDCKADYLEIKRDGENKLYTMSKSTKTGWTVVGAMDTKELLKNSKQTQLNYIMVAAILLLAVIVISSLLSKEITRPILLLRDSMSKVEEGKFQQANVEVTTMNEIGSLTKSFNVMTKRIQELMEQNVAAQKEKRKSEMKALQAQINPHFLYNTLDSIIWMAEAGQNDDVVLMTSALAKLLRQSISNDKEQVRVEEEMNYVQSYLTIQKMRYKDKLEYTIDVDPEICSVSIIKFAIQPLVENAIYHGLKYKDTKGKISIRGYVRGKKGYITITDDGVGMDEETLKYIFDEKQKKEKKLKSNGVGVPNVQKRLQLYYGPEYGISYISRQGEGTVATVTIPLDGGENHE